MDDYRQHSLIDRFVARPPRLEGDVALRVEPAAPGRARVELQAGGGSYRGDAVALAVPYPSGLRRLIAAQPGVDLVLVERASPGFNEAARDAGVSYLDLAGRGMVIGPGFVYVAPPSAGARARGAGKPSGNRGHDASALDGPKVSPFAPKASGVARALLVDPRQARRLSEIAERAHMNPGNAHRILSALVDEGFLEREDSLYVVSDPGSLLEAWADRGRPRPRDHFVMPVGEPLDAEVHRVLAEIDTPAAVSGELAAELYAPHLPARKARVHCSDREAWPRVLEILPPHGVPSLGPQPQIEVDLVDPAVLDFGESRGGIPLVSPAQVYVDLARDRGRGRQAAEQMRQQVLGF